MCVVSMVFDDFSKRFPINPLEPQQPEYTWPLQTIALSNPVPTLDKNDIEKLRKYIEEFRESVELAKKLDVLMKQPDCFDPDKAKLEQRITELEKRLDEMSKLVQNQK